MSIPAHVPSELVHEFDIAFKSTPMASRDPDEHGEVTAYGGAVMGVHTLPLRWD
jgi:hypothetical protein